MKTFISLVVSAGISMFLVLGGAQKILLSPVGTQAAPLVNKFVNFEKAISENLKISAPDNWLLMSTNTNRRYYFLHMGPGPIPIIELDVVPLQVFTTTPATFDFSLQDHSKFYIEALAQSRSMLNVHGKASIVDPVGINKFAQDLDPLWGTPFWRTEVLMNKALQWHTVRFNNPPKTKDGRLLKILSSQHSNLMISLIYLMDPLDEEYEREILNEITSVITPR